MSRALTADEAMQLREWTNIRVRRGYRTRAYRGMVTGTPTVVETKSGTRFVLVPYVLRSRSYGATVDTYSRVDHVAQLGGLRPDVIELLDD